MIDGRLDDGAWSEARASSAFTQRFPDEGAPPSEATVVRVLYDDAAVYIGVDCQQTRSPISLRLSRRDREIDTDQVSVAIGSRGDGRTAFQFGITASGVQSDGLYYDDDRYLRSWDENWDAETTRTERGWSAEMRIPLRALRFDDQPVHEWGFNVRRFISARQETAEWSFAPRTEAGVVSRFGTLDNLVGLRPRHGAELRPFVLAEVAQLDDGFGPQPGTERRFSAGVDLKLHPSQNVTIDATINPDFGQVEADEVVLNLTNIETSHPEKRPFFLEGTDTFQTYRRVVYTRRIGTVPGTPALPEGESIASRMRPTPILGAAKVVGRPLPWLSLGALTAVAGRHDVLTRRSDGTPGERVAAPLTAYNILRLRSDFGAGSHLGLLATGVVRHEDPRSHAATRTGGVLCPSGQELAGRGRCFRDAFVAGIDGRWRSTSREYEVGGQALLSVLHAGPPRTLRDGTVVGDGDIGPLLAVSAAKEGGEHWLWNVWGQFTGRKADSNDLGFMERQNEVRGWANVSYRTTRAWGPTLQTFTGVLLAHQINLDGVPVASSARLGTQWQLRNFWWAAARLVHVPTVYDDREVGDGGAVERPPRWGGEIELGSDSRRAVSGHLEAGWQWMPGGARWEADASLRFRLAPQLDVDIAPEATFISGEPRFLERAEVDGGTNYLLADLRARSVGTTLRLTYSFTPRLSVQTYAQVFFVSRSYDDFTEILTTGPRPRLRLAERRPAAAPEESPDSASGVVNANVLLRWEYRLGSTLYLVYSRAQRPADPLGEGMRAFYLGGLTRGPAANAFMVKISYWWG